MECSIQRGDSPIILKWAIALQKQFINTTYIIIFFKRNVFYLSFCIFSV